MIRETPQEICVVAEYLDGDEYCLAKFMHEEDAREWMERQEKKDWVKYKLYKRRDNMYFDEHIEWEEL